MWKILYLKKRNKSVKIPIFVLFVFSAGQMQARLRTEGQKGRKTDEIAISRLEKGSNKTKQHNLNRAIFNQKI